jgi:uncharacterized damage-inducible protein DinB
LQSYFEIFKIKGMKEILQQFSGYHLWANEALLDVIMALPAEKQTATVPSSFNSLFKTALHVWEAEYTWWQRLQLQSGTTKLSDNLNRSMQEVRDGLLQQNRQWNEWVMRANEDMLQNHLNYKNSRGDAFEQPVYQILLHLFNHGTYHRGQLVNMLRQLGVDKISPIDFIVFGRKK